jgi:hypothetical protein
MIVAKRKAVSIATGFFIYPFYYSQRPASWCRACEPTMRAVVGTHLLDRSSLDLISLESTSFRPFT